jgi:hypothetical protein
VTPTEVILSKLSGVKKAGNGWMARCPAHDDGKASLSISEGDDARVLVKCHAGCTVGDICAATGLKTSDLFNAAVASTSRKPSHLSNLANSSSYGKTFPTANDALRILEGKLGKRSAMWTYENAKAKPVGLVLRWDGPDGKEIRPVSRLDESWSIAAMPEPRPLYQLPTLASAGIVVVTEGEKAADAAISIGFTTTTSAGGAQAAGKTDWAPLAGKEVWILPDNDSPGRKYASEVAGILSKLMPPPAVKIIELPGLPPAGDIVDWLRVSTASEATEEPRRQLEELAAAVDSEKDRPASDDAERFAPFPVEALPEPIRSFVAAGAKAIGCDMSYLALPLLTSLAAAIGNTRRLELKRGWSAPPIIWCAIVGESGTAKTPAFKLVMRPIRERQRKAMERHAVAMKTYEADLARWEKCYAAWKKSKDTGEEPPEKPEPPPCERFIVSDTTVEALSPILLSNPRGLLLARDELAGWLGSFDKYAGKGKASADSAHWLSMFNAENIIVDRKTGDPRTIFVPQAAMCVCGGIQPGILNRALGDEHRESGLAARLLLTCPLRKAKQWTEADIDPALETALARLVDRLFDLQPTVSDDGEARPVLVRLTADAKTAWTTYYNAHGKEQAELTGDMAAAWSKLEEYAARLALVIHYARWAAGDVANELRLDLASMKAGIVLATWFKGEARRVYALLGESDGERDQRRLVEWIDRTGGSASVRSVQQGCRWLKEPGAAEAALTKLVNAGLGSWASVGPTPRGGRPSREFKLARPSRVYDTPSEAYDDGGIVDVDTVDVAPQLNPIDRLFLDMPGLPD